MATISFSMHRFVRLLLFGQFWLFQNLLLYSLQSENRFSSATRLNLLSSPLASVLTGRRSANPFKSHSNRNALKFSSGRHTESSWLPSISEETYLVDNDASYFWPSTALPIQWPSTNTEAIIRPVRLANRPLHDDLPILNLGPVRSNRPSRIPNRKTKRRKRKPSKSKRYRSKSTLIAKPTAWIDYSTLLPAVPISLYDPSYMSFLQANTRKWPNLIQFFLSKHFLIWFNNFPFRY